MQNIINLFTTENIIQGGAVLLSLALIWVIYKLVTNHDRHLQHVVDRNTDAWSKNADALTKLTTTLDLTHKPKKRK